MSEPFIFESQRDGVHSPESFGFDMRDDVDVEKWSQMTGEEPLLVKNKMVEDSVETTFTDSFDREMTYWESQGF